MRTFKCGFTWADCCTAHKSPFVCAEVLTPLVIVSMNEATFVVDLIFWLTPCPLIEDPWTAVCPNPSFIPLFSYASNTPLRFCLLWSCDSAHQLLKQDGLYSSGRTSQHQTSSAFPCWSSSSGSHWPSTPCRRSQRRRPHSWTHSLVIKVLLKSLLIGSVSVYLPSARTKYRICVSRKRMEKDITMVTFGRSYALHWFRAGVGVIKSQVYCATVELTQGNELALCYHLLSFKTCECHETLV